MEESFYRGRLGAGGIEVVVPSDSDRVLVNSVIYDELVVGNVNDASRRAFRGVIAAGVRAGAEGVVLGCTEIELLIGPSDAEVPVFASTFLHATAAVDAALAGEN